VRLNFHPYCCQAHSLCTFPLSHPLVLLVWSSGQACICMYIYQLLFAFRYYGVNDPVARKMMQRVDTLPKLSPPEDASITTLYIGGLTPVIGEDDIRDQFYSYGELQSVKKVRQKQMHLHWCVKSSPALHTWPVILNTFGASIYICAVARLATVLPVPIAQQAGVHLQHGVMTLPVSCRLSTSSVPL